MEKQLRIVAKVFIHIDNLLCSKRCSFFDKDPLPSILVYCRLYDTKLEKTIILNKIHYNRCEQCFNICII
jgi:hypothetical protein